MIDFGIQHISKYFADPSNKCPNCGWQNSTDTLVPSCPMCQKGAIKWGTEWMILDTFFDPESFWLKDFLQEYLKSTNPEYRQLVVEQTERIPRVFSAMAQPNITGGSRNRGVFSAPGKNVQAWIDFILLLMDRPSKRGSIQDLTIMMASIQALNLQPTNDTLWAFVAQGAFNGMCLGVYYRAKRYIRANFPSHPINLNFSRMENEIDPTRVDLIELAFLLYRFQKLPKTLAAISILHLFKILDKPNDVQYFGLIGSCYLVIVKSMLEEGRISSKNKGTYRSQNKMQLEARLMDITFQILNQGYHLYPDPRKIKRLKLESWFAMLLNLMDIRIYRGEFESVYELYDLYIKNISHFSSRMPHGRLFKRHIRTMKKKIAKAKTDPHYLDWFKVLL